MTFAFDGKDERTMQTLSVNKALFGVVVVVVKYEVRSVTLVLSIGVNAAFMLVLQMEWVFVCPMNSRDF